ncbi:hypothetical protein M3Y99_01538700 [Aphelenchoides fujianensis]|nr:hypothetical protein M3Y99_01538700 [Aphelenchoides fujianensis]
MHVLRVAFFLLAVVGIAYGHPAYQHHFHRAVRADNCLAECMKIVQESELELSILKRANISGFLLDLENICATVRNASDCMATCGHKENPFTLKSMTTICSEEARKDVELLTPCLLKEGNVVYKTCRDSCGDYEAINDEVHTMTMAMSANPHHAEQAAAVLEKTGEACRALKCSARCSIDEFNDECDSLANGLDAGDQIRTLIEHVLAAQRSDLEQLGLTDALSHSVHKECNYQYMPEVFFNETKDDLSKLVIEEMRNHTTPVPENKSTTEVPSSIHAIRHHAHQHISYSLSQMNARLIQKQFLVLEEQERNLQKEAKKLDLELELLESRKARESTGSD